MDAPRMRRRLPVLVVAVIFALVACSGGPASVPPDASTTLAPGATGTPAPPPSAPPSPSPAAFPLTITDDEGTTLTLSARPERIVSLTPAVTETLFALGAGARVVATTDFDDYPPAAIPLPDVATYTSVDVEKIVGLEADLVIAGGNFFNDPDAIARLRTLRIPVLVVYAPDVDTVLADVELIGRAVGESATASELAASMRADIAEIAALAGDYPEPRVFYELDATSEIYGPADDSFLEEMITLAGGDPITTGSPTAFAIPLERLVTEDPEIILLGDAAYGVTADQVKARPGWDTMTAVKADAIEAVPDVLITRPGPRLAEGLYALAVAIHPEAAQALGGGPWVPSGASPDVPSPSPSR